MDPVRTFRSSLLLVVAVALGLPAALPAAKAEASRSTALERRIAAILKKHGIAQDRAGIAVLERAPRGRVVAALGQTQPLIPASVAKVLTAASALDHLGPGYEFTTRVTARGQITGGALHGDLVVHGSGDPNLSGRLYDGNRTHVLTTLAKSVRRAGIQKVRGALVLDDTVFDRDFTHAGWTSKDKQHHYGAGVGGLAFNESCLVVRAVGSDRTGARATLEFPATRAGLKIVNATKTRAGKAGVVGGIWSNAGRSLRIQGKIGARQEVEARLPVPDPVDFFGEAFASVLAWNGVEVVGGIRVAEHASDRRAGKLVAEHRTDLASSLAVMNTYSHNFYASMIFKACGAAALGTGSWNSGSQAVFVMAKRRHVDDGGRTRVVDGSGLSPDSRVTAGLLAQVLHAFDQDLLRGPVLLETLPVSGESGTLRRRLRAKGLKGRIHAKTGTLNDVRVRSLAGYVDGRGGKPGYVFAILLNGRGANHGVIDEIVTEIARR